jgi:hypothetical protein
VCSSDLREEGKKLLVFLFQYHQQHKLQVGH